MDNTNLFTSSSDGSFQVNTNFANERLTNLGVNRAQEAFDAEMEARETAAVNTALQEAKPALPAPHNKDPKTMTQEERHAALQIIDQRMQSAGIENRLRGDSNRNPILGEITDGFRNIGQAFGVGNRVSGESGFVDADGKFHPRTCFTKGTLVTKLKARYYEEARNAGLTPNARYEEKVAIETIKAGDFVLSFDENTKVKSYKKVTELFHHEVELLYNLEVASDEIMETTWNHPFYVVREEANKRSTSLTGGWVEAKDLKAGDRLLNASGNIVQLKSSSQQIQEESISVYNFEVEDNHTYYVGDNGVLVHNYILPILLGGVAIAEFLFDTQGLGEEGESNFDYYTPRILGGIGGGIGGQLAGRALSKVGKNAAKGVGEGIEAYAESTLPNAAAREASKIKDLAKLKNVRISEKPRDLVVIDRSNISQATRNGIGEAAGIYRDVNINTKQFTATMNGKVKGKTFEVNMSYGKSLEGKTKTPFKDNGMEKAMMDSYVKEFYNKGFDKIVHKTGRHGKPVEQEIRIFNDGSYMYTKSTEIK